MKNEFFLALFILSNETRISADYEYTLYSRYWCVCVPITITIISTDYDYKYRLQLWVPTTIMNTDHDYNYDYDYDNDNRLRVPTSIMSTDTMHTNYVKCIYSVHQCSNT